MGKGVWDGLPRDPVDSRGGLKTTGSYSGLHNPKNAEPSSTQWATGHDALDRANEAVRRQLNEGQDFSGHLEERRVDLQHFWIGTHPELGTAVYADIPNSRRDNKIEVHHGEGAQPRLMSRQDFFGKLLPIAPSEDALQLIFSELAARLTVGRTTHSTTIRDVSKRRLA